MTTSFPNSDADDSSVTHARKVEELRDAAAHLAGSCSGFACDNTILGRNVHRVLAAIAAFDEIHP